MFSKQRLRFVPCQGTRKIPPGHNLKYLIRLIKDHVNCQQKYAFNFDQIVFTNNRIYFYLLNILSWQSLGCNFHLGFWRLIYDKSGSWGFPNGLEGSDPLQEDPQKKEAGYPQQCFSLWKLMVWGTWLELPGPWGREES